MPEPKPFGTMNELDPTQGLHVLKKRLQKKYMREQCEFVLAHVDEVIHHTFRLAPVRLGRRYLMDHSAATPSPKHREAKLERALHAQWAGACEPAAGCWDRLVA